MAAEPNDLLIMIANLTSITLTLYMWAVIIRVLISWVRPNPGNPVVQFLARVTDPALYYTHRYFPLSFGGVDFSPVVLILLIGFLNSFISYSIKGLPGIPMFEGLAYGMDIFRIVPIFFYCLFEMIRGFLSAYILVVIVRAVLSFISPDPYNPIVRFVYGFTEPVLYRIRSYFPFLILGGFDLSPILLIVAIIAFNQYVLTWLLQFIFKVLV